MDTSVFDYGQLLHLVLAVLVALSSLLLAIVGWMVRTAVHVFHDAVNKQEGLAEEVNLLKTKIAVLLDRDRRRRLADYEAETPFGDS